MDAEQRHQPPSDWVVVNLAGEIDLAEVAALRSRLAAAAENSPGGVVVDVADVSFLSCAALGPLLEAQRNLGGRLRLHRISPPVRMLLRLTGLDATFGRFGETDTTSPGRLPTGRRAGRERPFPTGSARWAAGNLPGALRFNYTGPLELEGRPPLAPGQAPAAPPKATRPMTIDDVVTTLTVLAAGPMRREIVRSAVRSLLRHDEASASPSDRGPGDRATRA